ncbi:cytochrome C oxidase subunit VI [Diplonema papillatum]|nr:cytochrome C oxidase subunit VI [Diplonema papillatum]
MGERRESAMCGKAEPITWLKYFRITAARNEPSPQKFEGTWFDGEEPEGYDAVLQKLLETKKEKLSDYMAETGFKFDNITQTKYLRNSPEMRLPRPQAWPMFSDFQQMGFTISYDRSKYTYYLLTQYNHCVGNLGEDHPTCRKAEWYYKKATPPVYGDFYEEMGELGHWDLAKKWGAKPRTSFMPNYQPVKQNIPGAYEFFRSQDYMDAFNAEGEGEISYPVAFSE